MEWFKKHVDAAIVLTAIVGSVLWMSSKFSDLKEDIGLLRTEIAIMKTVLIMKNIMPTELANEKDENKENKQRIK